MDNPDTTLQRIALGVFGGYGNANTNGTVGVFGGGSFSPNLDEELPPY
uniref:Uncharacterized protein n=1 Tax=Arundo donax TaxID=35708 RepID=A0A0A9FX28_ARUDO